MKYEISVIVPVYNTSLYLEDTINSLINQTIFDKIEVIFVNDGSTDNSGDICESYAKKFNNFKVCLVSSAAIKSTSFNILNALNVISSKFPIGVATIYNFPLILFSSLYHIYFITFLDFCTYYT